MKWCNPPKEHRQNLWHVTPPCPRNSIKQSHKWCVEQESTGHFYHHYTNTKWWFENSEDAIMFALTWSG